MSSPKASDGPAEGHDGEESPKLTPEVIQANLHYAKINAFTSVSTALIKWGCIAFIFYCVAKVGTALAGQSTVVDFAAKLVSDLRINEWLAWLMALLSGGYGAMERVTRKRTVKRLQGRIRKLEGRLNPKRGTSGLDVKGVSKKEDEDE